MRCGLFFNVRLLIAIASLVGLALGVACLICCCHCCIRKCRRKSKSPEWLEEARWLWTLLQLTSVAADERESVRTRRQRFELFADFVAWFSCHSFANFGTLITKHCQHPSCNSQRKQSNQSQGHFATKFRLPLHFRFRWVRHDLEQSTSTKDLTIPRTIDVNWDLFAWEHSKLVYESNIVNPREVIILTLAMRMMSGYIRLKFYFAPLVMPTSNLNYVVRQATYMCSAIVTQTQLRLKIKD